MAMGARYIGWDGDERGDGSLWSRSDLGPTRVGHCHSSLGVMQKSNSGLSRLYVDSNTQTSLALFYLPDCFLDIYLGCTFM